MRRALLITIPLALACGGLGGASIPNPIDAADFTALIGAGGASRMSYDADGTTFTEFDIDKDVTVGGVPCAIVVSFHADYWECFLSEPYEVRPGYKVNSYVPQSFHYGATASPYEIEWVELENSSAPPIELGGFSCTEYIAFHPDGTLDGCSVGKGFSKNGIDFPAGTMVMLLEGGDTGVSVGPGGTTWQGQRLSEDQLVFLGTDGSVELR